MTQLITICCLFVRFVRISFGSSKILYRRNILRMVILVALEGGKRFWGLRISWDVPFLVCLIIVGFWFLVLFWWLMLGCYDCRRIVVMLLLERKLTVWLNINLCNKKKLSITDVFSGGLEDLRYFFFDEGSI